MKIMTKIICIIFIELRQIKYIAINASLSICNTNSFVIIFNKVKFFKVSSLIFNFFDILSSSDFFVVIWEVVLLSLNSSDLIILLSSSSLLSLLLFSSSINIILFLLSLFCSSGSLFNNFSSNFDFSFLTSSILGSNISVSLFL